MLLQAALAVRGGKRSKREGIFFARISSLKNFIEWPFAIHRTRINQSNKIARLHKTSACLRPNGLIHSSATILPNTLLQHTTLQFRWNL